MTKTTNLQRFTLLCGLNPEIVFVKKYVNMFFGSSSKNRFLKFIEILRKIMSVILDFDSSALFVN